MGGANPRSERQALVLMSGGIDSSACGHFFLDQGLRVTGAFIDHGQAASSAEQRAVAAMAAYLKIPLKCFSLSGSEPFTFGELVGRNAFLAFSALFLMRAPPGVLAMGLHSGTPYYDCSPSFVESMARLIAEYTDGQTAFVAPFLTWRKRDVYDYFQNARLPLALTYSCESGSMPPCGACASCRDRRGLGC